ncbi:MAG: DNA repair protein RecO [Parcubacteria group bacterium]|jgi:DNA repair protein RecO (recombination protein O)
MDFKYTSLILSKCDINEVDRIYNFFTLEEGKIQAVGRGVRKPNAKLAGNLEPLTHSEIYVSRKKGLGRITGAIAVNNFSAVKADFSATSRVFWALSLFDKLITQQEKDARVFELFLEYLEAMEKLSLEKKAEYKFDVVTLGFLFKLMESLGYKIRVEYCANCGQKITAGNDNYFSAERGGALCAECAKTERKKVRNSDSSIKLVKIFLKNKIGSFSKLEVNEKDLRELKLIWKELIDWV